MAALGQIHRKPEVVIPALLEKLNSHPDAFAETVILESIGDFGLDAKTAAPDLRKLVDGSDPTLQRRIRHVLQQIEPKPDPKPKP